MTNRPTVYVVDDDADFRKSIVRLLRLSGYDIASYESADELLLHLPGLGPRLHSARPQYASNERSGATEAA